MRSLAPTIKKKVWPRLLRNENLFLITSSLPEAKGRSGTHTQFAVWWENLLYFCGFPIVDWIKP